MRIVAAIARMGFENQVIAHPNRIEAISFSAARAFETFFRRGMGGKMRQQQSEFQFCPHANLSSVRIRRLHHGDAEDTEAGVLNSEIFPTLRTLRLCGEYSPQQIAKIYCLEVDAIFFAGLTFTAAKAMAGIGGADEKAAQHQAPVALQ